MANHTDRRGRGPAPTGQTPPISMRLPQDTRDEISALKDALGLDATKVVVLAVRKLYGSTPLPPAAKKSAKKSPESD